MAVALGRRARARAWWRRRPRHLHVLFLLSGSAIALAFGALDVLIGYRIVWSEVSLLRIWLYNGLIIALPTAVALIPAVRQVEGAAARSLLGVDLGGAPGPARSWSQRLRTVAWFWLHLLAGGVVAGAVYWCVVPGVMLIIEPLLFQPGRVIGGWWLDESQVVGGWAVTSGGWPDLRWTGLGLLLIIAAAVVTLGCGSLLASLAPRLLGPTPEERLATLTRRTARLVERTQLARELHDSVGHALSLIVLQLAVVQRRLDQPADAVALEPVQTSLTECEAAAQAALADLDGVLGLLRDEEGAPSRQPTPDLADLPELIRSARAAGQQIELDLGGVGQVRDWAVPSMISREAYRIVQEGLTNAIRHAPDQAVTVGIRRDPRLLIIELSNPVVGGKAGRSVAAAESRAGRSGGRGLTGLAERAALLGGELDAGAVGTMAGDDQRWRVAVRLPISTVRKPDRAGAPLGDHS